MPKQRYDDRRTGHHQDRPEQRRQGPIEAEEEAGRYGREHPRGHDADACQVAHHATDLCQLCDVEAQTTLEENDRDREGHDGKQRCAEQFVGIDPSGDPARDETGEQQQKDCGQPQAPGQPLRSYSDDDDAG